MSAAGLPLQKNWLSIIAFIWAGQAVSMITSYAAGYAVVWYVTESTGSALVLSIMTIAVMLPVGLISPFGGIVADKHNRKLIMIVADGAIGVVSLVAVMAVACSWFNGPTMTLTQRHVPDEKMGRAMGLLSAVMGLASPVGVAIGGVLAELIGIAPFFLVDGLACLALGLVAYVPRSIRALDSKQPPSP